VSLFCGDNIRGEDEECDAADGNDLCTARCESRDALALAPPPGPPVTLPRLGRRLGEGRHPTAVGPAGFAAALIEPQGMSPSATLSTFSRDGDRLAVAKLGTPASFVDFANPVVAALPDGTFVVAWTSFGTDGDGLGIALQRVDSQLGVVGGPVRANATVAGSQLDADILVSGEELTVAWVDYSNPITAPDVRYRRFSPALEPLTAADETLADTGARESNVSLLSLEDAPGGWCAAWRSLDTDGSEQLVVRVAGQPFRVSDLVPGPASDRPALMELDGEHLLVLFSEGTDPENGGVAAVPRLRFSVIDTVGDTELTAEALEPLAPEYVNDELVGQSQPTVVRIGARRFFAWRSNSLVGSPLHEETWLKEVTWASPTLDVSGLEAPLPRSALNRSGDQRAPALAGGDLGRYGALFGAWEDYGETFLGSAEPDVVVMLRPL